MKRIFSVLKRIWIISFVRRVYNASQYFNYKYGQILKWGFNSNEYTNFTYNLTEYNLIQLAQTIAVVCNREVEEVIQYIYEAEKNELLKQHIISETNNSKEGMFADQEVRFGKRLGWYAFVRILKPTVVVETGVDKGLGSVILCSALEKNSNEGFPGKYYGTDIDPKAGYLLSGKYKNYGEILYGDSISSLLKFPHKIDIFINDSDHSEEYEYREYATINHLLNKNAIILGDNSHVSDKLSIFSKEHRRQFLYFQEKPLHHWYPGAGIGISFVET